MLFHKLIDKNRLTNSPLQPLLAKQLDASTSLEYNQHLHMFHQDPMKFLYGKMN